MPYSEAAVSPSEIMRSGLCIGCGACVVREQAASMTFDRYGQLKPAGDAEWQDRRSVAFSLTCPFSPLAQNEDDIAAAHFPEAELQDQRIGRYEACHVGHVVEDGFRDAGSSGGLVTWVATELLRRGLADGVAHVGAVDDPAPGERLFRYRLSRSEAEVRAGAKSRYYPVELAGVLREIRASQGRFAVIGLPCFIKAVRLTCAEDPVLRGRIAFTLGLFCGHMKSARMVESFAWQMGVASDDVVAIDFRRKHESRPANWYRAALALRDGRDVSEDWMHFADGDWGAGFFQNSACNFCDDVVAETADISFGDAWIQPYASDGCGTNVMVTRSRTLLDMIETARAEGRLDLKPVDADLVHETQAAGFRHRREGLALRLAARRSGVIPRKRVAATRPALPLRRWAVYRLRETIALWSHRVFHVARRTGRPAIYLRWARTMLTLYQALAWSQGRLGRWIDRLEKVAQSGRAPRQRP